MATTLSDLRSRVRLTNYRLDNTEVFPNDVLDAMINRVIQRDARILRRYFPEMLTAETSKYVATIAGQNYIDLPSDCKSILSASWDVEYPLGILQRSTQIPLNLADGDPQMVLPEGKRLRLDRKPLETRGVVDTLTLTAGGSGYTSAPTVTISGGTGSGATATATITGDAVTSVSLTAAGSGYLSTDTLTVTFSGGGGSNAAATASVSTSAKLLINYLSIPSRLVNTTDEIFTLFDSEDWLAIIIEQCEHALMIWKGLEVDYMRRQDLQNDLREQLGSLGTLPPGQSEVDIEDDVY